MTSNPLVEQRLSSTTRDDRRVCVLFTDLVASTKLFDDLGDETAYQLIAAHLELLAGIARAHGGEVVKNLGDGLMIVFRYGHDGAQAAIEMQRMVGVEGELHPPALRMRVGLAVGDAIHYGDDYFGSPVIVASRLCALAQGCQILASNDVAVLAQPPVDVTFEPVGSRALKGIADPVPVCEIRVLGAFTEMITTAVVEVQSLTPLPRALRVDRGAFVGRRTELDSLDRLGSTLGDGLPHMILLEGGAGVGKSRLAAEFALRQHAAGAVVLFGRCDRDACEPFQPFVEALQFAMDSFDEARGLPPATLASLRPLLTSGSETHVAVERLAAFAAADAVLAAVGADRQLVFLLDDVHLADPSTLALLRHLCRSSRVPMLIVATVRSDELTGRPAARVLTELRRGDGISALRIGDLAAHESAELVAAWAGARPAAELCEALWQQTRGNPFYTREILRSLLESEDIVTDGRELRTVAPLSTLRLPDTVRAVLDLRTGRLSGPCLELLGAASTIGEEFSTVELGMLADAELDGTAAPLGLLEEAVLAGVVEHVGRSGGVFRFDHGITRKALHDDLPTERRARFHLVLGQYFESRLVDGTDALADVARHFADAIPLVDALIVADWLERAGEAAMRRLAYEDAAGFFERSLDAYRASSSTPIDRMRLLRRLGSAQIAAGVVGPGRAWLREAATLAESLGHSDELADIALSFAGAGLGLVLFEVGIVDGEVVELIERALAALSSEDSSIRAKLLCHKAAASLFFTDHARRRTLADESVAMARRVGDPEAIAYVSGRAEWARFAPGAAEERLAVATEAVELAKASGDRMSETFAEIVRYIGAFELGSFELVAQSTARIHQLARSSQDPYQRLYALMVEGARAIVEGRLEDAERLAAEVLESAPGRVNESGFDQPSAGVLSCYAAQLAAIRMTQGRIAELRPAIEQFARDLPALPVWRCVAVLAQLHDGDQKARGTLRALALNEFPSMPRDMFFGSAAMVMSAACRLTMDPVAAQAVYDTISDLTGHLHTHVGITCFGAYDRALGELSIVLGDYDRALTHLDAAQRLHRSMHADLAALVTEAHYAELWSLRLRPGDRERALAKVDEVIAMATPRGHGYALLVANAAARRLGTTDESADIDTSGTRPERTRAAGRAGARWTRRNAKTVFTRSGQVSLRSVRGRVSQGQAERVLATTAAQRVLFTTMAASFQPERARGFTGTLSYVLRFEDNSVGDNGEVVWHVTVGANRARAAIGDASDAKVRVHIAATDFVDLLTGELGSITALMDGRALIEGDFEVASRMVDMFGGIPSPADDPVNQPSRLRRALVRR